jgi:hypothetical protein
MDKDMTCRQAKSAGHSMFSMKLLEDGQAVVLQFSASWDNWADLVTIAS